MGLRAEMCVTDFVRGSLNKCGKQFIWKLIYFNSNGDLEHRTLKLLPGNQQSNRGALNLHDTMLHLSNHYILRS